MEFAYLLIALIAGSVGSVALAGLMLLLDNKRLECFSTHLLYLAGGTLLGAAFLGMIPKAASMIGLNPILKITLAGILFFFVLEKVNLWMTCQNKECERHTKAAAPLILIGDAFHNAIDGVVIAASFLTSTEFGIFVTISVILHKIPQELGDFGILVKSGYSRQKAIMLNLASGSTSIFFGIAAYFTLEAIYTLIPFALAFSASSFIYIALVDLIPEMHRKSSAKDAIIQFVLIMLGILVIFLAINSKYPV